MKKLILSFSFVLFLVNALWAGKDYTCYVYFNQYDTDISKSLKVSIPADSKNVFYVGETVVIPIETEGCGSLWSESDKRTVNNCQVSYEVKKGNINFSSVQKKFLTSQEISSMYPPEDVDKGYVQCHWRNQQDYWMELQGRAEKAGDYTVSVTVKRGTEMVSSKNFNFKIYVAPSGKAAILSKDDAASFELQMEIYSKIRFSEGSNHALYMPYMDYYATRTHSKLYFNVWNKPKNTCLEVLDCGNSNYVFRQRFLDVVNRETYNSSTSPYFQLGLFETNTSSDTRYSNIEKNSGYNPEKSDYSYKYLGNSVANRAMERNDFYNSKMALYEGDGTLVYGTSPSWLNSSCQVVKHDFLVNNYSYPVNIESLPAETPLCDEIENPITIKFDDEKDVIYEGEDYFALPTITSTAGEIVSLEIVNQDKFDWLETGTPKNYWESNYNNSQYNLLANKFANKFYVRSINGAVRQDHNLYVDTYTYTLMATDSKGNRALATRKVEILDGSKHPSAKKTSGLAVLIGDETWFVKSQLDIASGIERYADTERKPLKKGYHYDYYGQVNDDVQNVQSRFHNWYSDDGISQTLYDCGDGRYKIKYEFTCESQWYINFNQSVLDVKTGIVHNSGVNMHKERDYSMSPFVKNGELELYARKYNPNVPLYDENDNLLWGNPPEWHNQCGKKVKFIPSDNGNKLCYDGGNNGGNNGGGNNDGGNGSSVDDSKGMLTAQFWDISNNKEQGQFLFNIFNKGSEDVNVFGYEMWFYYGGNTSVNAENMAVTDGGLHGSSYSTEKCGENLHVLKIRIDQGDEGTIAKAGSLYPLYDHIRINIQLNSWIDIGKSTMHSWIDVNELTDNPKMSLFDNNGKWVYGEKNLCNPSENQSVKQNDTEYELKHLSIQFQDPDKKKKTQSGDFKFQISNSGDYDYSVGNYEMRFFFESKKDKFDASDVRFFTGNIDNSQVTKEWCGDGKYFMKIKLASDAVVKANSHFPDFSPINVLTKLVSKENEGLFLDYYKNDLFSWISSIEMADNSKMGLFDAEGNFVWGYPGYKCDNPITVTQTSTVDKSRFVVEELEKLLPYPFYDEETRKNVSLENGINEVSLKVKNVSELDEIGPVYVDYYITHPVGQNPLFCYSKGDECFISSSSRNVELSTSDVIVDLKSDLSVMRKSSGNKHVYRFILKNGLKKNSEVEIKFSLRDECADCLIKEPEPGPYFVINPLKKICESIEEEDLESFGMCDGEWDPAKYFIWKLEDDWSAEFGVTSDYEKTEHVVIYSKNEVVLYGHGDDGNPKFKNSNGYIPIPGITVQEQFPNRTDAVVYSGGQLLLNGDFEEPSLLGWNLENGEASSVRGNTVQGSRFLRIHGQIRQTLPNSTISLLLDSGAVLSFWHRSEECDENASSRKLSIAMPASQIGYGGPTIEYFKFDCSVDWKKDSIFLNKTRFMMSNGDLNDDYFIRIISLLNIDIDDIMLVPGVNSKPSTYAVRLTTTQHEELETRAFDNDRDSVVITSSKRDAMGRNMFKYLPFNLMCSDAENCNADPVTLSYPDMAKEFYKGNPDYADAQGFPYKETIWKPDPVATKDVEGFPGKAFSLDEHSTVHHVTRAYSSGVNLSNVDIMNFSDLASAINAVRNCRVFADKECKDDGKSDDGVYNFHAAKDNNPTHIWELNVDPNGRASVTVKDGEGHIVISGAMEKTSNARVGEIAYELKIRNINELDARGNVVKSHSPLSCEYNENSSKTDCVWPSEYVYDSQSRVIRSWEPDLKNENNQQHNGMGSTITYYDIAGRVRATQTQNQIEQKTASIMIYDNLDRVVATGEWKHGYDESNLNTLRANLLLDESDANVTFKFPTENDLIPGTITRTFYDNAPLRTDFGVELYPNGVTLDNTRGRIAAIISDVSVEKNQDGSDKVIRVSIANSYDKYGRVLATYTYDPTVHVDSLKLLATENKYDLGGKLLLSTSYPFGLTQGGVNRAIKTQYSYDRLGRIDYIMALKGGVMPASIARYEYYPTGAVRRVTLGNDAIAIDYTYHISGAVKTAVATNLADNSTLFSEALYYEDCGSNGCMPQYNGNISRVVQSLAHGNTNYKEARDVMYAYDFMNRLTGVDDKEQDEFDEYFAYDAQGRITSQRRGANARNGWGGEYSYYAKTNKLEKVANGMGGESANNRNMSASGNFVYDSEGNLIEDKSKSLKISYDWRGMPVEFVHDASIAKDAYKLLMAYDGSGRRVSKTRYAKHDQFGYWTRNVVTHYTGIGTEVRETHVNGLDETKVVVNLPQGLGRYTPEDAVDGLNGVSGSQLAGYRPPAKFEWYLKNHLGSTMLVYGTSAYSDPLVSGYKDGVKAAYDYRAFGEQVDLAMPAEKVTENFTGKEKDDETELNYFGARYLDPMLGLWTSVDPKRQFASPYLYAGNGMNPVNGVDDDGNDLASAIASAPSAFYNLYLAENNAASRGESYLGIVGAGLTAFFTTLGAGFLLGPAGTGEQLVFGAVSAATVEVADQAVARGKTPGEWDWNEIGHQARNGAILGTIGGVTGDAVLSVLNLSGEGAGIISGAVGTLETIGFTAAKEAGYIEDEWDSCSDR